MPRPRRTTFASAGPFAAKASPEVGWPTSSCPEWGTVCRPMSGAFERCGHKGPKPRLQKQAATGRRQLEHQTPQGPPPGQSAIATVRRVVTCPRPPPASQARRTQGGFSKGCRRTLRHLGRHRNRRKLGLRPLRQSCLHQLPPRHRSGRNPNPEIFFGVIKDGHGPSVFAPPMHPAGGPTGHHQHRNEGSVDLDPGLFDRHDQRARGRRDQRHGNQGRRVINCAAPFIRSSLIRRKGPRPGLAGPDASGAGGGGSVRLPHVGYWSGIPDAARLNARRP